MKRIALLGAGNPGWQQTIIDYQNKGGAVYTDWTFRIRDHEIRLLENQIEADGEFKIFFYEPKSRGGDMKVRLIGYVSDFTTSKETIEDCPEPDYFYREGKAMARTRTWLKIERFEEIARPMDLSEFWNHRTRRRITASQLRSSFAYIADVKEMETDVIEEDEGYYELALEESFMENEIASNPEVLGLGELELVDRQKVTPAGRPDLIFYHEKYDIHIIVELKKLEITQADLEQATRYHEWGKEKFGQRLITLLVGFWVDEDFMPRLEELTQESSGIFAMVYESLFRIV